MGNWEGDENFPTLFFTTISMSYRTHTAKASKGVKFNDQCLVHRTYTDREYDRASEGYSVEAGGDELSVRISNEQALAKEFQFQQQQRIASSSASFALSSEFSRRMAAIDNIPMPKFMGLCVHTRS